MNSSARCLLSLLLLAPLAVAAKDVIRHKLPNGSTFPISAAVEVPSGKTMVYLSGVVPPVLDAKAARGHRGCLR